MDDPRFEPRILARLFPFAWSGVAGSPPRSGAGRPISFTPSRTGPSAPLPWPARPAAESRSATASLAQVGVWLVLALGWLVFASWWVIVLRRERIATLLYALGVLAVILVATAVVMALWTRYNIWLAARGIRGRSSRYIPMRWEHDTLGRPLVLPARAIAWTATEVRVVLRDGAKTYVVEREAQP